MTDQTPKQPQLTLYNSLTRRKEVFAPMDPKRVTMYNCGPTVYSYAHIGNARAAVVADVLFRVLRHIYGEDHVEYARNITDVDDKIIAAANEQGVDISVITEKYAQIYNDDLAALGCLPPTHQPKATDNIGGMIAIIQKLLDDDYAYAADGHVFFDVSKFEAYGKLSGNTLDALKKGDRVGEGEVARKRNAADFVLWKPEAGGVGWDAPFGRGRPGWHIECSAMAKDALGETIDIHCGGVDLKFPHHENEIAQSECAHGKTMANYWVHNEFLNMGNEKMSKSLGNVKLIHDLLKDWDGEVIRLALLKAHYRSELIWSEDLLKESKAQLDGWYGAMMNTSSLTTKPRKLSVRLTDNPMYQDLSIPEFLSEISDLFNKYSMLVDANYGGEFPAFNEVRQNRIHSFLEEEALGLKKETVKLASLLGLLQKDPEEWFTGGLDTDKFDALAADYDTARAEALAAKAAGDKALMGQLFKRSDEIRDALKAEGVVLETGTEGSTWRKG